MNDISLLKGHVYHSRSETAENSFRYPIMNVYFSVDKYKTLTDLLRKRFFNLISYDSGPATEIKALVKEKFNFKATDVFLQTIPKMFGYAFNPISFWYFFKAGTLEAVLCEVSNTFGEKHYYWLYEQGADLRYRWLLAKKEFHVSPFFDLNGYYKFKFLYQANKLEAHIQFINADHSLRLVTWIKGELSPLQEASLVRILLAYGWMTPLVVFRIHFQAAKLYIKKVKFFSKPQRPTKDVTHGTSFTGS